MCHFCCKGYRQQSHKVTDYPRMARRCRYRGRVQAALRELQEQLRTERGARDVREARCHGQARSPLQDASWFGVLGGMRPAARRCTPWAGKTGRTQAEA